MCWNDVSQLLDSQKLGLKLNYCQKKKKRCYLQCKIHWTFRCLETLMIATSPTQVVCAATHLIFPWKVRQMPQIIVGLPLDRTFPPGVLPCWLSEVVQVTNVSSSRNLYWAAAELCCDTTDVRRKCWRMRAASVIADLSSALCSAAVKRNLNVTADWMTELLTDFLPGWMGERMDRTYSMLSTNAKISRGRSWNTPGMNHRLYIHTVWDALMLPSSA